MDDFLALRTRMVDSQLKTEGITDAAVLAAFAAVPRERFVPARLRPIAYIDNDIAIKAPDGAGIGRYLMEPAPLARLVQAAAIRAGDIALVVGAGTGYSAAIIGQIARGVAAVESDPELADESRRVLKGLDVGNVAVVNGPLAAGYPRGAPYDVILIDGSVEVVPAALFRQLHDAGRLVAVVGAGRAAEGTVFTRTGDETGSRPVFNAAVRPLPGFDKPAAFIF